MGGFGVGCTASDLSHGAFFFFLLYWRKDESFPPVNLDPFLSIYYKAQLKKICMIFIILDFFLQN